jgi:YesN/AraC family two-component response regulator
MFEIHLDPMSSGLTPVVNDPVHLSVKWTLPYQRIHRHPGGRMTDVINLMIVDDSSRARLALTAFLSLQVGVRIIAQASNGLEAVDLIQSCVPDVVLMDMKMPVMDGLEATRIIKNNWPGVKVIILSMYSDYLSEAILSGADKFLVKGCSVEEIMSAITGRSGSLSLM